MREILFKAKDLNGNWVKGFYIEFSGIKYIVQDEINICVQPDTVCQYIGSRSIYGPKIYEGDKLLFSNEEFTVVYFDGKFTLSKHGKPYIYNPKFQLCEITGNIHD